jgi:hypothetical protein
MEFCAPSESVFSKTLNGDIVVYTESHVLKDETYITWKNNVKHWKSSSGFLLPSVKPPFYVAKSFAAA